ncbi:hypothetical protein TNCV_4597401 [Trichonephila clavipes]|nr:hypothetical protein TNCV_4597401 [Trichonephila clavipes]
MALRFSSSDTMMEGPTLPEKKIFFAGKSAWAEFLSKRRIVTYKSFKVIVRKIESQIFSEVHVPSLRNSCNKLVVKIADAISSSPVPLKNPRVKAQTSFRWCRVEVRRLEVSAQVSSSSLDRGSKLRAGRTTSKRIRYGFITIKSTTLIGLNSPRKNTTLPAIRFVEPRRTNIPV